MSAPSKHDREAAEAFARGLVELQGLTRRQRQWKRLRQAIDRGEITDAEMDVICNCHVPTCVVHGEMPPVRSLGVVRPTPTDPREGD